MSKYIKIQPVDEDIEDWDYYLKDPPLSSFYTLEVTFEYLGCSEPLPYREDDEE